MSTQNLNEKRRITREVGEKVAAKRLGKRHYVNDWVDQELSLDEDVVRSPSKPLKKLKLPKEWLDGC